MNEIEINNSFITVRKEVKDEKGNKKLVDVVVPCQENVLIAMRTTEGIKDKFRYNIWLGRKETLLDSKDWRALRDNDYNLVKSILANRHEHMALITASQAIVINALIQYCEENSVDPAREYLESLVWDKTPRIDRWLIDAFNADDTEENKAFGSQWLKGLVKRVIHPGCKFDHVLVLEGEQGIGKSTSLSELVGGNWHIELTTNAHEKDFFMLMLGKMIVEFSEGAIQERTDMKLLKSIITKTVDTYRAPYSREVEDHPRRCVFAMTVNDKKYLKDETGNRRWLPVECKGKINLGWIRENKDQLLAEAYHRAIVLKESLYEGLYTEGVSNLQESRRIERVEEELIFDWYSYKTYTERNEGYTLREIYDQAIGKGKEGFVFNQLHNQIIPPIIKNLLCLEVRRIMKDGIRKWKYFPTEKTTEKCPYVGGTDDPRLSFFEL